jgi:hemerythrin-like domain-containing protein
MKITEALLAEHMVFHNLFDRLEATVPTLKSLPEVKLLAALLESLLRSHSDTEDALFIGPLEHCFEQIGQRDAFIEEHQEIDQNLERVQAAVRVGQARELLLAAVSYSRRHFDKEERLVFPMAERLLKSKTLTQLGQTWLDERVRVARAPGLALASTPRQAIQNPAVKVASAARVAVTSAATRVGSGKSDGASSV